MITLEEVIEAYFDCRRRKRNTASALEFEMDYEHQCIELWREINERRYRPRRSIAFVVEYPVKREIFAADFRDRVVHHLIARRIYPLLERQFHPDSYSTQKGKGTLYGIGRLEEHIRQCSHGYTRDCYILKLDISGYFMSIDKRLLYDSIQRFVVSHCPPEQHDVLLYLLWETIFNRPEHHCIRKVPPRRWRGLPPNKSLFGSDGLHGLPIGNLTSQLLALLFLDPLDHLITGPWGVPHYGRYVDDMVLVHPSSVCLAEMRQRIGQWLAQRGLRLHPRKMYLQHYSKGVMFVGGVIKPGRKYVSHRTVGRMMGRIHHYNRLQAAGPPDAALREEMLCTLNSYLGMLHHYDSRRLFHRVLRSVSSLWYGTFYFISKAGRYKMKMRK